MLHIVAAAVAIAVVLGVAGVLFVILSFFYPEIVEVFLLRSTNKWYGTLLGRLSSESRLLDIGSGITKVRLITGITGVTDIVRTVLDKEIKVVALEPEVKCFKESVTLVRRAQLKAAVIVHNKPITDTSLKTVFTGESRFDAVCCSSPLMSMPDPVAALRMSATMLKPGGLVFVPQVYKASSSPVFGMLSPLFKLLRVSPTSEVEKVAQEAGLEVAADLPAVAADGEKTRVARILVLQPRKEGATSQLKEKESAAKEGDSNVRSRKK